MGIWFSAPVNRIKTIEIQELLNEFRVIAMNQMKLMKIRSFIPSQAQWSRAASRNLVKLQEMAPHVSMRREYEVRDSFGYETKQNVFKIFAKID